MYFLKILIFKQACYHNGYPPPSDIKCKDWHTDCSDWEEMGECKNNRAWMVVHCRKSCDCCNDKKGCSSGAGGPDPGQCDYFVEGRYTCSLIRTHLNGYQVVRIKV